MLYRGGDGRPPALVIEDGETVTISAARAPEAGIPLLKMRPRTTAALLVMAGKRTAAPPRLSDAAAFEEIDSTDGFVRLSELDGDGRIAGYSVPFLRGVIDTLDPSEPAPPRSVTRLVRLEAEESGSGLPPSVRGAARTRGITPAESTPVSAFPDALPHSPTDHSVIESYVPSVVQDLKIFDFTARLGDIVVGRDATLVLDKDLWFAWADNLLGYTGSRVVQRAPYFNLDVTGTVRGGILGIVHAVVADELTVNWTAVAAQKPTMP